MSQEDFPYQPSEPVYDQLNLGRPANELDELVNVQSWIERYGMNQSESAVIGEPGRDPDQVAYDGDPKMHIDAVMRLVGGVAARGDIAALDIRPRRFRLREDTVVLNFVMGWHARRANANTIRALQKTHNINPEEYHTRAVPIFRKTLATVVSGPRIIARNNFTTTRQDFLRTMFEERALHSETLGERQMSDHELKTVEQAIQALSYIMPVADFMRLSDTQQTEIVDHIASEYVDFLSVVYQNAGASVLADELFGEPAIRGSVSDLRHVIDTRAALPRSAIRKFLYDKQGFDELALASRDMPIVEPPQLPSFRTPEYTEDAEQEQACEEAIRAALHNQQIGEVVQLKPDGMQVTRAQVAEISAEAFYTIGTYLYHEAGEQDEPAFFNWTRTEDQIYDRLLKSFNGSDISRPRLARLPLSKADEALKELTGYSMALEPRRYAFIIDVKSTGRAKMSLSIGTVIVPRYNRDKVHVHRKVDAKASSEVEQLIKESSLVAGVVSAYNASAPMQGGLPGLGKQR